MPTDPAALGLREAARLVARRTLRPSDLVEAVLARIGALNPALNAYLAVHHEGARRAALRADRLQARRGRAIPPLLGVPVSIKDLVLTQDAATTAGSRVFGEGILTEHDAPVVARLRRAGAVIIGKTNLHEMAYGVTTVNEHFGPARNPWRRDRVAGGSSGGSAVAVAAGLGAGSVGTDTRGSIRIPAACCGITGLKPTYGLLPTEGVVPLAPTLDHLGPMTRTAEDAALLLGAMQGSRARIERYLRAVDRKPRRLRVAVVEYFVRDAAPEMARAVQETLRVMGRLGWDLHEAALPELDEALAASRVIVSAEALAFHEPFLRDRPEAYGPLVRSRLEAGGRFTAVDLVRAEQQRVLLTAAFGELFSRVDLVVGAALPVQPPAIGTTSLTVAGQEESISEVFCRYQAPQNVIGVPAIVLPGPVHRGLPTSTQLIATWGAEETLLGAAGALQRETDWHTARPPV